MLITYDEKSARYRDERGRFVSEKQVRATVEKTVSTLEDNLRGLARNLHAGKINLAEFQIQAAEKIKSAHIVATAIGKGGREQLTPSDWGKLGSTIREQYKFLNNFVREIEAGRLSPAQIEHRASLYAKAPRSNFFKNEKTAKLAAGFAFAKRILNAAESCSECAAWASKGFIPIEEQPEIGSLVCKSFCKCAFEYKQAA